MDEGVHLKFFSSSAFPELSGELAKKLGVSLIKMNDFSRERINYFAINVQLTKSNNEITTCTIAFSVWEMQAQHTSEFIRNLVEKVLKESELTKEQVLAVVMDNASNMISAIDKLNVDRPFWNR